MAWGLSGPPRNRTAMGWAPDPAGGAAMSNSSWQIASSHLGSAAHGIIGVNGTFSANVGPGVGVGAWVGGGVPVGVAAGEGAVDAGSASRADGAAGEGVGPADAHAATAAESMPMRRFDPTRRTHVIVRVPRETATSPARQASGRS